MHPVMPARGGSAPARRRRGFTLIEILMVAVLAVLVLGGMMSVLVRQQRFYLGTADLLEARSQTRQAAGILPTELRALSPVGGDILSMSDDALEIQATVGSSAICALASGLVTLPPINPIMGNAVTTWAVEPAVGDTVLIFNEGPTGSMSDDSWSRHEIAFTQRRNKVCPVSTGLTTLIDSDKFSVQFTVVGTLSPNITAGAPIRFLRRASYSLYAGANGKWYLGYCSPQCGPSGPDPIAGPFVPVTNGEGGIQFTYLDANGAVTADPEQVAQVSVLVRAESRSRMSTASFDSRLAGDSLRFTVGIRNRQ
jgi:hypothetical protein